MLNGTGVDPKPVCNTFYRLTKQWHSHHWSNKHLAGDFFLLESKLNAEIKYTKV